MAGKKAKKHYSGIGGQAVLEGIMMKNKEQYSVAVRKADGTIETEVDNYQGIANGKAVGKIPFVRGVINFADSLILGMRSLNFSATFYAEEEDASGKKDDGKSKGESGISILTGILSVAIALALFMVLPVYITKFLTKDVMNPSVVALVEGGIRLAIFLIYIVAIALMRDIRRVYMYHGAEHKCINCIERGRPLTVGNVMRSSRLHKRCGTSFLLFVVLVSIVVFFFIRVDNMALKVLIRILLIPVIAGISYELLRLAGKYDNAFTAILSAPGLLLQRLTTREPDEDMAEVAIAAVEAVFDWRKFLLDEFGYDYMEDDKAQSADVEPDEFEDETPEESSDDTAAEAPDESSDDAETEMSDEAPAEPADEASVETPTSETEEEVTEEAPAETVTEENNAGEQ